ncbi:hypothetical protein E1193_13295 [Micromonospora sp. KC606]|uniref:hypothetical protein n=1 Tax=Micromonospora sp. KC606 TaxID=2530379 RepID=UPI001046CAEF|nr:hypothetical protein [Micromonospora sp. KC606]TDC81957.1 hypothetical protein E1193_13295 [Micromonospora sp. KC606]
MPADADAEATPRRLGRVPCTGTGEPAATPARATAVPRDAAPAGGGATPDEPSGGAPDPSRFTVAMVVLGLAVGGLVAVRPSTVQAAPAVPIPAATDTACAKPRPGGHHLRVVPPQGARHDADGQPQRRPDPPAHELRPRAAGPAREGGTRRAVAPHRLGSRPAEPTG